MKGSLATLLALVCFFATHAAIASAVSGRVELRLLPDSTEAQKFAHFRAHADEYELVFVGTSRVFRGFDPATFDASMAERGHALHSYNFGLLGMGFLEERYVVEWILACHPARLRWILIEPTERSAPWIARPIVLGHGNEFALRDVLWHTPAITLASLESVWSSERTLAHKLQFTRSHLLHGAHRLCNVGVGAGLLARWLAPGPPAAPLPEGFEGRDEPGDNEVVLTGPREPEATDPSPFPWQTLSALARRVESAGAHALFVIPPAGKSLALYEQARARGELPQLLTFPLDSVPELRADARAYFYDPEHLDVRGAQLFSRLLAERLAAEMGSER